MGSLYPYRNKYVISYSHKGKRKRIYTQLTISKENLAKAKNILKEIELRFENPFSIENNNTLNATSGSDLTLEQSILKFTEERLSYKSAVHIRNFSISMRHLYEVVDKNMKITDVTSREISLFIAKFQPRVANATLHTYIRYLKSLFNYLVDEDIIVKSPVKKKLVPKRERKNVVIFKDSDLDDIFELAKERDINLYFYLKMLLFTGLRPSDLVNLKVGNFDFNKNIITIKISKTSKGIKFPIYDELKSFIDENMREHFQKDKEMAVFEPFNIEIVRKRFLRIKRVLMLPTDFSVTLKTFRKTFATRMAERGLTIQEVAYLLGHDSVQTTERFYTDVIADSVRKRINNLK